MTELPIERVNETMDFDGMFPTAPVVNDAQTLVKASDATIDTESSVAAPTHTASAINAASVYTLVNPDALYYYNDILSSGNGAAALVLDATNTHFSQNKSLSQTILKNELGPTSLSYKTPRKLKPGQTLHAPDTAQITALYYRLIDQLTDQLTINELNLVSSTHGYVTSKGSGNAVLKGLTHNVINLNDYFTPLFDSLYRTCINGHVLKQVRSSYHSAYQPPSQTTIQSSANASDHNRISSLLQARGFIHGVTWLMFTTAMNNIFAAKRSAFISNWSAKVIDELTPYNLTIFDTADPKLQQAIDNFERLRNDISVWIDQLVVKRRAMLRSHPRYKTMRSPEGCITFFEAHRWLHIKSGEVYFDSSHLVSTANLLIFSGYIDQFTTAIDGYQETKSFAVSDDWQSADYFSSMNEVTSELSECIEHNESLANAFEQAVLDNHRHYYPPSALVTMFGKSRK